MNFEIKAAKPRPTHISPGKSVYPWHQLQPGQGFFVPDEDVERKASGLKTTAYQWARRHSKPTNYQAWRHCEDGVDGVWIQLGDEVES